MKATTDYTNRNACTLFPLAFHMYNQVKLYPIKPTQNGPIPIYYS